MKKNLFLFLISALFAVSPAWAIPGHNISLNFGVNLPGETEIADFYNGTVEPVRGYQLGLGYDFAPMEFISVGAGINLLMRSFSVTRSTVVDTVNLNAIEPFGQVRFYYAVIEGVDVFAGGGGGYAVMTNSSFVNGQTVTTTAIEGGAVTYKFGGGIAYNQGIFTAILDIGYKSCAITPSTVIASPVPGGINLAVNLGGFYINMSAAVSFGNQKEARHDGEIKKQLDNEVKNLDDSGADSAGNAGTEPGGAAARDEKKADAGPPPESAVDDSWMDSAPVAATPVPAAAESKEAVNTETAAAAEKVQVAESADDTDGIIIISPGESETSELEKYISNKRKQFTPVEEEAEAKEDSGTDLVFNYGEEDPGIIVVEAQSKGTVDKAGYVLVEKGGFISGNFAGDGYIYSLDEHKEMLSAGDFAYIKLTAGIGAPKGKQFTIFDDSEEVTDPSTGESMGKMIKFLGVAKVAGPIEDNIFKVQITKSYDPIRNNYKIKARQELKKYHKDINLKVKKKNLEVRCVIVKVKDDVVNLKSRDLVYLDAGIAKGLLPGEKMGIYRQTTDAGTGKQSEYKKIGTLIIINSMQASSVGLIVKNDGVIRVGDIVKTTGK